MKRKLKRSILCLLSVLLLLGASPAAAENAKSTDSAQTVTDEIIAYQLGKTGADSVQSWIDGALTQDAGTSAVWYTITLSQYGDYRFTTYEQALLRYLSQNKIGSASSRQKYALALIAAGSTDSYISDVLDDSIGRQGIMSWIFGLHLLNNGYQSRAYTLSAVKQKLLSLQLSDGGWAVMGKKGDIDTTAMALQALAPHYQTDSAVKAAVERALTLLSERQKEDGDYVGYDGACAESTAQVLTALSSLGINCETDRRFIKNGNTLWSTVARYRLPDGSYCHKAGKTYSETATVQVFYAAVSYLRMQSEKPPFYLLDGRKPDAMKKTEAEPDKTVSDKQSATQSTDSAFSTQTGAKTPSDIQTTESTVTNSDSSAAEQSPDTAESEKTTESSIIDSEPDTAATAETGEKKAGGYKLWLCLAVLLLAGGACAVLCFRKKQTVKRLVIIGAAAVAAILLILVIDFPSADRTSKREHPIGTVTVTVRCDTLKGKTPAHIPDNCILLDETEIEIEENDTIYDALRYAAADSKLSVETTGGKLTRYVEGIGNLYEFDYGDLSGWLYFVNGVSPSVGCSEYKLKPGDKIEWHYTCDLGEDLKESLSPT